MKSDENVLREHDTDNEIEWLPDQELASTLSSDESRRTSPGIKRYKESGPKLLISEIKQNLTTRLDLHKV